MLKNPPSRPMAAPPRNVGPPDPVPADIQEDVAKLAMPLQTLLVPLPLPLPLRLRLRLRLPLPLQEDTVGVAQACLGKEGYVSLEDLAYRWDSPEDCRKQSPEELSFKEASQGPKRSSWPCA